MWFSKVLLISMYLFLPFGLIKSHFAQDIEASKFTESSAYNYYKGKLSKVLSQAVKSSRITSHDSRVPEEQVIKKEDLLGKIDPTENDMFAQIPPYMASSSNMYLRVEAKEAFVSMHKAALGDGVNIKVISAFRSFDHQKRIWEEKWHGKVNRHRHYRNIGDHLKRCRAIMAYSAMPGTSRHHWGTDIDINSLSNAYFETAAGKKLYNWMQDNAHKYGFCEPYSAKGTLRQTGYEAEKWHWSYQPLASQFLKEYINQISYTDIKGFAGSDMAVQLKAIEHYVLGISTHCD